MAFTAGNIDFENAKFDGSIESLLWDLESGSQTVTGALAAEDAVFRPCQFTAIGLTTAPKDLKRILQMITVDPV